MAVHGVRGESDLVRHCPEKYWHTSAANASRWGPVKGPFSPLNITKWFVFAGSSIDDG